MAETRNVCDIKDINSEAGIIASIILKPELIFYSEQLKPNHFSDYQNAYIYFAVGELVKRGVQKIDAYNITNVLNIKSVKPYVELSKEVQQQAETITIQAINDLIDTGKYIARSSVEEYKLLVKNVLDAAFRRDTYNKLVECEKLCFNSSEVNIEQQIYSVIDDVMTAYATTDDIPPYSEKIDDCWKEIQDRQSVGYSGIPFKFQTLNNYVTIEKGELVVFAAEAKQGKSMLLLNCAIDLLKQDKSVLYLDSELNTRLFTARVLAHLSGIEYRKLVSGDYGAEDAQKIDDAIKWMKTRRFTHIYIPCFDLQSIYTAIKKVQHTQDGIDVLVVDYFKSSGEGDAWASYAELGRFVDMIKNQVAGEMGIAAIGAAQATATGKVADSAKIGRNASTICILQDKTPEEVEADGVECGNKKLRVVLNRNGAQQAPGEYIDMFFDGNHIMYSEAKQHIPEVPY